MAELLRPMSTGELMDRTFALYGLPAAISAKQ